MSKSLRGSVDHNVFTLSIPDASLLLTTLIKSLYSNKNVEKLDLLRQIYLMCSIFPPRQSLLPKQSEINEQFVIPAKFIQFIFHELGYKQADESAKPPNILHKNDKSYMVRLEALLSICACRFLSVFPIPINTIMKAPTLNKLLRTERNKLDWGEITEMNRRLLWQPDDEYKSDQVLDSLLYSLDNTLSSPFTLLPAILQRLLNIGVNENTLKIVESVEQIMTANLKKASTLSEYNPDKKRIFNKTPTSVLEIDGTMTKDFFTVLCSPTNDYFTTSQRINVLVFSNLYQWLDSLYYQSAYATRMSLGGTFKESILSYCQRVIEQSKLIAVNDMTLFGRGAWVNNQLQEQALIYAIRIIRILCKVDTTNEILPSQFTVMKAICNRSSTRQSSALYIELLRFFIEHSEVMMYDPDPIFNIFFQQCLPKFYTKPLAAFETLLFCNQYKEKLLNQTKVFTAYFPPLMKLYCWFPMAHTSEIVELLPALISPVNFTEIFHTLLDLPLMTCAMEKSDENMTQNIPIDENSHDRVLFNYLLRNESGVSINFWDSSTTFPLLQEFCKTSVVTPRVRAVASLVPALLETYFDVLIANADTSALIELLPLIVQRLDQLYPLPSFQTAVKRILLDKVLAIFHMHPSFIISQKALIIHTLEDTSNPGRAELILVLLWLIGEYANPDIVSTCTEELIKEYHEKLEFFAFERTSLVKNGITNIAHLSTTPLPSFAPYDPMFNETVSLSGEETNSAQLDQVKQYTTRLMLIVIGSVSKLAARCPELSTLSLQKILQHSNHFDSLVTQRATECMTILKFPSIASAILNSSQHHNNIHERPSHISEHTSLRFLLQSGNAPTHMLTEKQKLHQFEL